jgi:hypothetical protein
MALSLSLDAATANGAGAAIPAPRFDQVRPRNPLTVYVWGTFGGATVKVQVSPDGANWFDLSNYSFSAIGCENIDAATAFYRLYVTGASGATSLTGGVYL